MSSHGFVMKTLAEMLTRGIEAPFALKLDLGGCRIGVNTNSPELLADLDAYFGPFVTTTGAPDIQITALEAPEPEIPFDLAVKQPDPGKEKIKEEYADLPGGRVVRKRLTGMVFLFGSGLNLAIGPCGKNPNQVVNFINNRFIEYTLNQDCLLGHSAAVGHITGGRLRGLAMAGFSGAGKSTLALHVMSRGALFVSNDRLLVRENGSGLQMYGVAKLPRINPGTALNNPQLAGVMTEEDRKRFSLLKPEELWKLEHKYDVLLDQCFGEGRFVLTAPMQALVILNWKHGAGEASINFVKAAERLDLLPAFMKPAGLFHLPLPGKGPWVDPGVEAYAEMLSKIDLVEVTGGVDFDRAADFCMEYLLHG